MVDAKPNLIVVKLPGLSGGPGNPGAPGISAVNNIVNPVLSDDLSFNDLTEINSLGFDMPPSASVTFDATLVLKGLEDSTAIISVEGPNNAIVSSVITSPYNAAPGISGNKVSFGITSTNQNDSNIVRINGSIKNADISGRVSIFVENIDGDDGGFVGKGSFVQWSIPITGIFSSGPLTGSGGGLTKEQADLIYPSRNDSRLTDERVPKDRSVNANKIASGGLPISSIDQLRNELDSRVKTINGISPDTSGNVLVSGSNGVAGITLTQADARYPLLTDTRLSDQRVPLDNSVINPKVPNNALDVGKVNGLSASLDAIIAQMANITYRLEQIEKNGTTPGTGTPGTGYPAVYQTTY